MGRNIERGIIFGYGSIGRRHINNLLELGYSVDVITSQNIEPSEQIKKISLDDISNQKYRIGIVANRNESHLEAAQILAKFNIPTLIEKPISNKIEGLESLKNIYINKKKLINYE